MKRTLYIASSVPLEFNIVKSTENQTWYFVHWNKDEIDENGNYTIYTYKSTFGERIPVFQSKDWVTVCNVGNLLNGMFHRYFKISNKYPLSPTLTIDTIFESHTGNKSVWVTLKQFFIAFFRFGKN